MKVFKILKDNSPMYLEFKNTFNTEHLIECITDVISYNQYVDDLRKLSIYSNSNNFIQNGYIYILKEIEEIEVYPKKAVMKVFIDGDKIIYYERGEEKYMTKEEFNRNYTRC